MAVTSKTDTEAGITRLNYSGDNGKRIEVTVVRPDGSDPYDKDTRLTFNLGNMGLSDGQKQTVISVFPNAEIKSPSAGNFHVSINMGEDAPPIHIVNELEKLGQVSGIPSKAVTELTVAYRETPEYEQAFIREAAKLLRATSFLDQPNPRLQLDNATNELKIPNSSTPYIADLAAANRRGR